MSNVLYHKVQPLLVKDYKPQDLVEFELYNAGRSFVPGSVRLTGQLEVLDNLQTLTSAQDVKFDHRCGIANFIDNVSTSFGNKGMIETISNYSRLIAMTSNATESDWDMMNSSKSVELKSPDAQYSQLYLQQPTTLAGLDGEYSYNPDFSHRLFNCLNRVSSSTEDNTVPFDKIGVVRTTLQISSLYQALFGDDMDASVDFTLKNLEICYTSVPDMKETKVLQMKVEASIKTSLDSSNAVITTRVPIVSNGCSVSFQRIANENVAIANNVQQEELPDLTETTFLFSNSNAEHITYVIRDRIEILDNYIESMKAMGMTNTCNLNLLKANKSFGVGLPYEYMNLSSKAFNIEMRSGITSGDPYVAYLFFHGIVEL